MSDNACGDAHEELDRRVLGELCTEFPVSQSPYCDLGLRLGIPESDVLESVERLRACGDILRIGADFKDERALELFAPSQDEMQLVELLSSDLPWSEHPFAEIADELQERGIDAREEWVLERTEGWLSSGVITRLAAETA